MRLQPRGGRVRWWHLYADAHGAVEIARNGRGTGSADQVLEQAFLGRNIASDNSLVVRMQSARNDDDDVRLIGVYGSGALIASGILALIFPSSQSILRGSFTQILRVQTADVQATMAPYAVPAVVCGTALLAIDLVLWLARGRAPGGAVVAAIMASQAVIGSISVIGPVVLVGLLLINLIVWILETILVLLVLVLIITGLFAGAAAG